MRGMRAMRTSRRNFGQRPGWFNLKPSEDGNSPSQIHIYDEIGMWGIPAADFMKDLKEIEGDVEMHINSPGGDIFDGIAIFNLLQQHTGLITVVIDGLAASAASFIAQAASPEQLFIAPHAQMMIHDGFAMSIGNAADLRETADLLDKASDNIANIYATRTGRDSSYWRERMRLETWYSDQEAVDAGLADAIHGPNGSPQNGWDLSVFATWRPQGALLHAPYSGTHSHSHPSFGHRVGNLLNDDGGNHDHEHDHDNDANHDHHGNDHDADDNPANTLHQLILNAAVDESPWDRDRAMHEAGQSDSPAKAFAKICAGRKDGSASEAQNWALPHHYPDKEAPNAAGVRNALSRLSSTKGLTNTDAAKAHLHSHMKTINPDWEPDDESDFDLVMTDVREALNA